MPSLKVVPIGQAPRDYKTVMARMNREGWEELSFLSTELDRPLEDLTIEALNDLLVKNGKRRVIAKRSPRPPAVSAPQPVENSIEPIIDRVETGGFWDNLPMTLSVEEAAKIMGYSKFTAYRAVKSGDMPVIRFGKKCRVPTAKLKRLMMAE